MLKRAFDILSALFLLVFSLPLILIAAILIKLDSEGPVLFRQSRMGRRFVRFQLYKLRTMTLSGDGPAYTLGADPRITRVGRWLRRYKLDELPQLWNVLRGDMSIVGPRPVIPELAIEFEWAYVRLLSVRPGLTDPASLQYSNETEILQSVPDAYRYFKTVLTPEKIRISLAYMQSANLQKDIGVVIKTAIALAVPTLRRRFGARVSSRGAPGFRLLSFPPAALARNTDPLQTGRPTAVPVKLPAGIMEKTRIPSATKHDPLSI